MAVTSYPWTSVDGDRVVASDMDIEYFKAAHGEKVITGLVPTRSGGDVSVSAGTAIVQGRVVTVDAPVVLTPETNRRSRIVLRLNIADRTAEVALSGTTTTLPALTRSGAVWELGLGTVDTTGGTAAVTDTRRDFTLCGMYDTGWVLFQFDILDHGLSNVYVRRIGDTCHLQGSMTNLYPGDSAQLGNLPAGYRPVLTDVALSAAGFANSNLISGRVNTSGGIGLRNNDTPGANGIAVTAFSATYPCVGTTYVSW